MSNRHRFRGAVPRGEDSGTAAGGDWPRSPRSENPRSNPLSIPAILPQNILKPIAVSQTPDSALLNGPSLDLANPLSAEAQFLSYLLQAHTIAV